MAGFREMKDFAKVQQSDTRIHFKHELVPILSKPDSVILGKEGALLLMVNRAISTYLACRHVRKAIMV